jgi:3-hydroxybutyryl-CoA dehydratase
MMNEYIFSEVKIGDTESFVYTIDERKMKLFKEISGDENPLHTDSVYAEEKGFAENVVYGQLTAAALSTLAGMYMPGKRSIIHSIETQFLKPVFISKCPLLVTGIVKDKDERFKTITLKFEMFNTDNVKVCKGKMRIGFLE